MWWAYPVQNPGAKLHSAAILLGAQGGGKTLIGDMVKWACYGEHFHEIGQDQLDSRFNASYAANCSLIMGSEVTSVADWRKRRNLNELLKHWATAEDLDLEAKHKDSYRTKNLVNLYLTANPDNAFHIEGDDRRYFIHRIPDTILEKAFFAAAADYFKSDKGKAALHYHLLNLKIDPELFDPKGRPPDTEAKRNAKADSQNAAESWLTEFVEAPEEFVGRSDGQLVFRIEEAFAAFPRTRGVETKAWSRQAFERVFRKKFTFVARTKVDVLKGQTFNTKTRKWERVFEKKKTGLWVRTSDYKAGKVQFLKDAKATWARQRKRVDWPKA
jgi:hypothetical protein